MTYRQKLLPEAANSVSIVLDYTDMKFDNEEQMKDTMLRDNVLTMFGINYKLADESIMEIQVYDGMKDGKTVFDLPRASDEAADGM